jgi:hypothetical protein
VDEVIDMLEPTSLVVMTLVAIVVASLVVMFFS